MGIVESVVENSLGEVTEVVILKGATRERVRRHVTSLIRILTSADENIVHQSVDESNTVKTISKQPASTQKTRSSAVKSRNQWKKLLGQGYL
jgi:hypothetical protein